MRTLKKTIWPYQVYITVPEVKSNIKLIDLDKWCKERVGKRFADWYSYDHTISRESRTRIYAFKDEATLLVFKLTWSHYGNW